MRDRAGSLVHTKASFTFFVQLNLGGSTMGTRGPLKLPTHLRPVTDTEAANTVAEVAPRMAPEKPASVSDDEDLSALWDALVPALDAAGMLSPSDGLVIELALRHVILARVAYHEVASAGTVTLYDDKLAGGAKKHPAEQVMRSESEMFLRYAQQLGMTFISRARTPSAKAAGDGEENPFASPAVI